MYVYQIDKHNFPQKDYLLRKTDVLISNIRSRDLKKSIKKLKVIDTLNCIKKRLI